jgi:hypothetical protein
MICVSTVQFFQALVHVAPSFSMQGCSRSKPRNLGADIQPLSSRWWLDLHPDKMEAATAQFSFGLQSILRAGIGLPVVSYRDFGTIIQAPSSSV